MRSSTLRMSLDMKCEGLGQHLARMRLLLSRILLCSRWGGMSVLASVEEAMEESEGLLGLEPTWKELKDQLVVAVDALSVSLLPTSSAQVTALYLDQMVTKIKEDARSVSSRRRTSRSLHRKTSLRMSRGPVRVSTYARARCIQFLVFLFFFRLALHRTWSLHCSMTLTCLPAPRPAKVVCRISTWQSYSRSSTTGFGGPM